MPNAFNTESWPDWLVAVAIRVDELVDRPKTMERFHRMLGDWKAEHDSRGPKSPIDKRGHIRHNVVDILPRRRLSLATKYAALAAIHDVICEEAKRIDPWSMHKGNFRSSKAKAGVSFIVLCSRVGDLQAADRGRIEGALLDVETDLAVSPTKSDVQEEAPARDAPLRSHVGDGLLRFLAERPEPAATVVDLPARFQDPDILTVCDAAGPIEQKPKPNETDWRDVQHRLLELYGRGEVYTTIVDLSKRMECGTTTIHKAIKDSAKLKGWQARHTKGSPRASSLTEIVMDKVEQTREPDPAQEAETDDVDTVFARLIQEAKPDERAELRKLTADQRRQMVELLRNDPDKFDRVLDRKA